MVRLVNLLITHALESRASDIHIEPFESRLVVRFRIDGVLNEVESPPRRLSAAVISRVKIMANLDIAERRLPAGRAHQAAHPGQGDRPARLHRPHDARRERRDADPRQGRGAPRFRRARLRRQAPRDLPRGPGPAARRPPRDRPHRLGQDDHALHRPRPAQPAGREDPHRGGSRRVPDAGHQPDPGEAPDQPHVRERAALDRAAGPGRDHDRRDPRPRDRRDRRAVRAHRPPRAVDRAHERRALDGEPPARHGRGGLPAHLHRGRHPRAAPRAHALHALPEALRGPARGGGADGPAALRAPGRRHALSPRRLHRTAAAPATSGASGSWRCCR